MVDQTRARHGARHGLGVDLDRGRVRARWRRVRSRGRRRHRIAGKLLRNFQVRRALDLLEELRARWHPKVASWRAARDNARVKGRIRPREREHARRERDVLATSRRALGSCGAVTVEHQPHRRVGGEHLGGRLRPMQSESEQLAIARERRGDRHKRRILDLKRGQIHRGK